MKTNVVCIDGTWNLPGQTDADPGEKIVTESETNVLRIFRFLTKITHENLQIPVGCPTPLVGDLSGNSGFALYLTGVGSSGGRLAQAWNGATGTGTSERIMEAYRFLAEFHEHDNQLFLFGFSRGAFAARSLAGFLDCVGLPSPPRRLGALELNALYERYRQQTQHQPLPSGHKRVEVNFLGVWDTVGALAFGAPLARWHKISPGNVKQVAHALALDERRSSFQPEFWKNNDTHTVVDEMWFLGAHSNVGGGYANKELSNIALAWMVWMAFKAGLPTDKQYIEGWYRENAMGTARHSHKEFLRWLGPLQPWVVGSSSRMILPHQRFHSTVFERMEYSKDSPYMPAARFSDGRPFPKSAAILPKHQVVETPDYLTPESIDPSALRRTCDSTMSDTMGIDVFDVP